MTSNSHEIIMNQVVSVVIIFFNANRFIREAIESVLAQTYESWELLLVDDGSTDGSAAIAIEYVQSHPDKIFYLEHQDHQNLGMSASRNLGIRNAKGEFIAILDADDVWVPRILEEQVAILNSHPDASMVYGPIQWWYSWTKNPADSKRDIVQQPGASIQTNAIINPPELLKLWLQRKAQVPSGILVRRRVIDVVGLYEEGFRSLYEDQAFCFKVCLNTPVYVSNKCWYKYRQHPNSCCNAQKSRGRYYTARKTYLRWVEGYLSEQKVKDVEVRIIVREELWRCHHPVQHSLQNLFRHPVKEIKCLSRLMVRRIIVDWVRLKVTG